MIEPTFDADFLNYVANHPDVRPWLGADALGSTVSRLDFQPLFDAGLAIGLVEPGAGGFVIIQLSDDEFECHTLFLPGGRGDVALRAAREAADFLFMKTSCYVIHTQLPKGNTAARILARRVGFVKGPERDSAWRRNGGVGEDWYLMKGRWADLALNPAPYAEAVN